MSVRSLANIIVVVKSRTVTSDGLGSGGTDEFATKFGSYNGRLQQIAGEETIEFNKETVRLTHNFYADFGQGEIVESDRIVFESKNYDVRLVRNIDFMDRHWEIKLELVK